MSHLTPDELIDAMEGALAADRHAHLSECADCQRQVDELSVVLNDAKQSRVSEPSPLFWNHFSSRVNEAIDAQANAWPEWLRWQVLLPLGATAMIILALAVNINPSFDVSREIVDPASLDVELADDNWEAVSAIVGELDIETASAAGVLEPGTAEQAVAQLTAEERQELTRLLQAELTRAKS